MKDAQNGFVLGLLFTLSACTLPDISIDRQQKRAEAAGAGFFVKAGDDHNPVSQSLGSKNYLATLHVRFGENSQPVIFDIRKNRRDLISANLYETEQTSTYLHLGFSHGEGGIAGLRFSFHF